MKKFLGILLNIGGIGLCFWGCWLGVWLRRLFGVLGILGGLVLCTVGQGLYDCGSLRPQKGLSRWVRTALFVSGLFGLVLIMVQRRLSHVGWYCVLMGLAIVCYCVDYGRHLPLDQRVAKLQNSLRIPLEDNFQFCINGYEERNGVLWAQGKLYGHLRVHDMAYLLAPHFRPCLWRLRRSGKMGRV